MNHTKQKLYGFCQTFAEERISRIQKNIQDIQESLSSETKSSAGDKHETGRAMLQLEREKLGQQLAEAERMKRTLIKVPLKNHSGNVGLGHWVRTTKADYFLAISAGEFNEGEVSVFCISVVTPIGQSLLGKSVGETVFFNGETISVLEVL